jgi:oxygen-independent coproporphyrinogen-3 oxidase
MKITKLGLIWHTNVILEFFNEQFWGDQDSLRPPNWSLNGVMVEVGAHDRTHWLGEDSVLFYPPVPDPEPAPALEGQ